MKKFCLALIVCCLSLFGGLFLYGCGDQFKINITQDSANLYTVRVSKEGSVLSGNNFSVDKDSNLRVEISANHKGVDFSNFKVMINGNSQQVFPFGNYDMFSNNLNYGYFLLPKVSQDKNISFSGAKALSTKFTLAGVDLSDAEVAKKVNISKINISGDYINLSQALQASNGLTKNFSQESNKDYFSFKMKFDKISPFAIDSQTFLNVLVDGTSKDLTMEIEEDEYIFYIEDISSAQNVGLTFNFDQISYTNFDLALPKENLSYKVECEKDKVSYDEEAIFSLKKLNENADYSNAKILANNLELTKLDETDGEINFKLEKGNTASEYDNTYNIQVVGVTYFTETYTLEVKIDEPNQPNTNFVEAQINQINESGEKIGVSAIDDLGNVLGFENNNYRFEWNYIYLADRECYQSAYNLKSYSLYDGETKILDLASVLQDKTETFETDIGDFKFKAFYNHQTQTFDHFSLDFKCTKQMDFVFSDLKIFEKQLELSFDFQDPKVEKVEVLVETGYEARWSTLTTGLKLPVSAGADVNIKFRIASTSNLSASLFDVLHNNLCTKVSSSKAYENEKYYLTYTCTLSDLQVAGTAQLILVKL